MKNPVLKKILALCVMGSSCLHASSRSDGEYLHNVTTEYETPHLNWGKPLKGEPVKALFITSRHFGAREVVELAQRVDVDFKAFVAHNFNDISVDSIYEAGVLGTSRYEKTNELMNLLKQDYDVIVLGNVRFSVLPLEAQYRILKSVSDGAGLIVTYPETFPYPKVLENPTNDWENVFSSFDGGVLSGQPALGAPDDILKTYTFGKGRIAVLAYGQPGIRRGLTSYEAYAPVGWKARYENSMAFFGRTLLWGAGRDLSTLKASDVSSDRVGIVKPDGSEVEVRVRDEWNNVLKQQSFSGEANFVELDVSDLPAGRLYVDAIAKTGAKVLDFGVVGVNRPSECGKLKVKSDKTSYEPGEGVVLSVELENPLEQDAEVEFSLMDLPDKRIWKRSVVPLKKGETSAKVELDSPHVPTIAAVALAEIQVNDRSLAMAHEIVYFPRRGLEPFPTIIWESLPEQLPEMYAGQLADGVYDAMALSHPGDKGQAARVSALFNQRFVPYTTRIGLAAGENGETLSKHWLGMSEEDIAAYTKGDGSFNNPAVREFWKRNIEHRVAGLPELGPVVYNLGDENYFSYEAGYSPADGPAFTQFLKDRYGDIQTLNKEWNASYSSFEEIGHPSLKEMREKSMYPAWYAHRAFMEKQYADTHHYLAEEIRKLDPHALVGAEGSVGGDLELTVKGLDFWGPYSDPIEDELLRLIAPEKLRTVWWGYGGQDLAYPLWNPLLKGIINGNSWYTSDIEALSGLMSVDFSLSEFYKNEKKPFVDALNRGLASLLISTPLQKDGIAILWSHASHSASVMNDRFLNPRNSAIPLMDYLYQAGLNFDVLTSRMLEQGMLKDYRILWLPGASALSKGESQAIEKFVQNGGVVVADIYPGVLNASCGALPASSLASLFGTPNLKGDAALEIGEVAFEKKVRGREVGFKAGKAYQSPEVPIFSVNQVGNGLAILLNFNLSTARNTAQTSFDRFLGELLDLANIRPAIRVDGVDRDQLLVRVRNNGENQVLGILANKKDIGKVATIELPKVMWVYEANQGLIGHTQKVQVKLDVPFKVFSLFATEQKPPAFSLSQSNLKAGESIQVDLSGLSPQGVYRLEVVSPQGQILPAFGKVLEEGANRENLVLRFALNDALGRYRVVMYDVRTGLQSGQEIEVSTSSP